VMGMEPVAAKEGGEIIEAGEDTPGKVAEFLAKAKVI